MDDFVKIFDQWLASRCLITHRKTTRQSELTASEIITLLVYYHHSGYKNFEYFYRRLVLSQMRTYFPKLVSHERFMELLPRQAATLHVLAKYLCLSNERTRCYFADCVFRRCWFSVNLDTVGEFSLWVPV